jgi:hypothetical protein
MIALLNALDGNIIILSLVGINSSSGERTVERRRGKNLDLAPRSAG